MPANTLCPPPPVMPMKVYSSVTSASPNPTQPFSTNQYQWASQYPDIQKACFFARVCEICAPKRCVLNDVEPILQHGPVCGLVCISMLMNGRKSAEVLLQEARQRKYSQNGEMFSAYYLFKLLESQAPKDTNLFYYDGKLSSDLIKNRLKTGNMLLVPYDSDKTHAPSNLKGHKAHWALIVGCLVDANDQFYVFARHGKTKNLALWSLDDLAASNANLVEFEQPHLHPNDVFILPEGGIDGQIGLRNKCIIVQDTQRRKNQIV